MMEEYITFSDDADIIGIWYCGTIEHHFWCVVTKIDNVAHIDFRMETDRVKLGMEKKGGMLLDALNKVTIPIAELGGSDSVANMAFHEILYTIAPIFMDQVRKDAGGVLVVGPCKGKEARIRLSDPKQVNWVKLLGVAEKGTC